MPSTQQANSCHASTQPCLAGVKRAQRRALLGAPSRPGKLMQYVASTVQHVVIGMLIFMLVLPPAFAGGIVADPNAAGNNRPGVDSAPNGVPLVNIVAPNQSGLSHNKYSDFNVQNQGAILNNAAKAGVSQLGGIVAGNPNIAGSRPASAILNEVTSSNRSYIQGYIEVFGQKADVILANPNGVIINGGGFLNTNRATVTTGKPVLDGNGAIQKFDVRQGTVNVEGLGINASNVTGFDIISRAAAINAEVYAQDLNVVAGANSYDVKTGKATALQPDGSPAPAVAIDSSALGGMYAGKITLVSTEKGVGVNLQGLVQAESDLAITSEGKLTVRAVKAGNNVAIKAGNNDIAVGQAVLAGNTLSIEGGNIAGNAATVHAGGNLFLRADDAIAFSRGSLLSAALKAEVAARNILLENESTLQGKNVAVQAESLELTNSKMLAEETGTLSAQTLTATGATIQAGINLALSGGSWTMSGNSLASAGNQVVAQVNELALSQGTTIQGKNVTLATNTLSMDSAKVLAGQNAAITANAVNAASSTLAAGGNMAINAQTVQLTGQAVASIEGIDVNAAGGRMFAGNNLTLSGTTSILFSGGFYGAGNELFVSGQQLATSNQAALYAGGNAVFTVSNNLNLADTNLVFDGSAQFAANAVSLAQSSISTAGTLALTAAEDITVNAASALLGFSGLEVFAANLTNKGLIFSGGTLLARIGNTLSNLEGADILSQGDMLLTGRQDGSRMAKLHNQAATIESLSGGIAVDADFLHNEGIGLQVEKILDSFQYTIIGWVGDSRGDDDNAVSFDQNFWDRYGYDRERSPDLPFAPDGSKNYFEDRVQLKKMSSFVSDYIQMMEATYGISAYKPNKGEGLQEWLSFSTDRIITPVKSASLMAGGNMVLNVGRLENTYSTLSAGGDMSITANTLVNQGMDLRTYMEGERFFVGTGAAGTREIAQKDHIYLSVATVIGSIPAIITAAGRLVLDVEDEINNSTLLGGEEYLGKTSGTPAFSNLSVDGVITSEGGSGDVGHVSMGPGIGGMFVLSKNPSHLYLIETDPRLTNFGHFYGSDYFLSRMGFNLEAAHAKLLGDAFYETRMVREQILAQAGTRYLFEGVTDDAETMRRLMDNAAEEGQSLGLSIGTALTSEQIASLTKDIVWLEEQTYMGQTVLVPRLYLADATKATLAVRGAMITGNEIAATSTSITNSGLVRGNSVQLVATEDLLNRGGDIVGTKRLVARADGSLINQSGTIGGGDVLLSAGQDIRLETVMLDSVVKLKKLC